MKRSLRTWTLAACAWLALSLGAGAARADGGPKIRDSVWLPIGMNFGYSINPDPAPNGFLVGPELSLVYLDESAYWLGAYTDVLRDFGSDITRLSAGLEGGVAVFGLDLGYVSAFSDGARADGLRGRLLFSLAVVHLYGGVGHLFGEPESRTYGEVGLLLKAPIPLWEDTTPRRPRYLPEPGPEPPEYPAPAPAPLAPAPPPGQSPFAEPPPE